jgi:hypothetical protein
MKKNVYETPVVETVELMVETAVLAASTESSLPGLGE